MEEASAIGDLQTVKEIFERFLIPGGEGMSLEERTLPGSALYLEVSLCQHGHAAVVSYLLEQGVKISNYVMSAVKEASQQVFTKLF
jgi:hypothetical protein